MTLSLPKQGHEAAKEQQALVKRDSMLLEMEAIHCDGDRRGREEEGGGVEKGRQRGWWREGDGDTTILSLSFAIV